MQLQPRRYWQITIAALASLSMIIVTGAAVRLTDSGLGCDDWPKCNDERLIDVSSKHAAIEQINRLFTGVVGMAVIAAVLGSFLRRPRRRDLLQLSGWVAAGTLANAIIGGISVRVDLHPIAIQLHLLLSMALISCAVVLMRRAGEPDGVERVPMVSSHTARLVGVLAGLTAAALFSGTIVTGAGPHAGDAEAVRLGIAVDTAARVHGITVMATLAIALSIVARVRGRRDERHAMVPVLSSWMFVGVLQAAVGYVQYFTGVPELLVGVHVAGATALTIVTTQVVLDTTRTPRLATNSDSNSMILNEARGTT